MMTNNDLVKNWLIHEMLLPMRYMYLCAIWPMHLWSICIHFRKLSRWHLITLKDLASFSLPRNCRFTSSKIDSILLHNQSRQYLVNAYYSTLVGSISSPDASNICAYCKGRSCKTVLAVEGIFCWNHLFQSCSGFAKTEDRGPMNYS